MIDSLLAAHLLDLDFSDFSLLVSEINKSEDSRLNGIRTFLTLAENEHDFQVWFTQNHKNISVLPEIKPSARHLCRIPAPKSQGISKPNLISEQELSRRQDRLRTLKSSLGDETEEKTETVVATVDDKQAELTRNILKQFN